MRIPIPITSLLVLLLSGDDAHSSAFVPSGRVGSSPPTAGRRHHVWLKYESSPGGVSGAGENVLESALTSSGSGSGGGDGAPPLPLDPSLLTGGESTFTFLDDEQHGATTVESHQSAARAILGHEVSSSSSSETPPTIQLAELAEDVSVPLGITSEAEVASIAATAIAATAAAAAAAAERDGTGLPTGPTELYLNSLEFIAPNGSSSSNDDDDTSEHGGGASPAPAATPAAPAAAAAANNVYPVQLSRLTDDDGDASETIVATDKAPTAATADPAMTAKMTEKTTTTAADIAIAASSSPADSTKDAHPSAAGTANPPSPSYLSHAREIASLGIPALGGMLIDPIMSLVDTACVGQVSSTQLAALAPCSSICQFVFFVYFFLSATTTSLVAGNPIPRVEDEGGKGGVDAVEIEERTQRNEEAVSTASLLALSLGTITSILQWKFALPLLKIAGLPSNQSEMATVATQYLRIRSLSLPLVLLATVLQGASLGRGDAKTPLKIFATAGIINLVGDVVLTLGKPYGLGWGAAGAAWATVASQVGAALYFVGREAGWFERLKLRLKKGASSKKGAASLKNVPTLRYTGLPSRSLLRKFGNVASTLLLRSIFAMLTYSLLTRCAATLGPTALAAHQVTLQLWWMLSWFPEPMVVAAQTLVARENARKTEDDGCDGNGNEAPGVSNSNNNNNRRVTDLVRVLVGMSTMMGVLVSIVLGGILTNPTLSGAFVADSAVRQMLVTTAPWAVTSLLICPLTTVSDGICIGLGELKHIPIAMAGGTAVAAYGLRNVARNGMAVSNVWVCMTAFFVVCHALQLVLSRRLKRFLGEGLAELREVLNKGRRNQRPRAMREDEDDLPGRRRRHFRWMFATAGNDKAVA